MATWVEDIIQALINLGGQASLAQIYEEVKKIRIEPLPETYKASIRERIEAHSSDSSNFKGKDHFRKVDKGVWALRELIGDRPTILTVVNQTISEETFLGNGGAEQMATWLEEIIQAFKNLGGEANLQDVLEEVRRIRGGPLPKTWREIIHDNIYYHSSDTKKFQGKKDIFRKVGTGVWKLRDQSTTSSFSRTASKQKKLIPEDYLPSEPFAEIENVLWTIKQYRDYHHPNSSSWKEYVDEFFHILGFSTEEKGPRLMTLNVMGSNHTPRAIVGFVHPGENFDEMVAGLSWESYLFFAAKYYQIDWGILTDGLQLKVVHYQDREVQQPTCWPDIDGVIQNEKLDTFCTIYKMFSFIKGDGGKSVADQGKRQRTMHGRNREDLADRHRLRLEFWRQLLDKAKTRTKLHAKVSPGIENWVSAGAGKSGLGFNYVVRMDDAQVELYIDRGEADWNKRVFNTFLQHKTEIEDLFGGPLDWQLLSDKRASRIRFVISNYGLIDQDHWDELQDKMIESMIRMEKAFRPFITKLVN